jgi:hypothetical protein
MTVLAGADAASRALGNANSPRITNKKVFHLLIADSLGSKSQSEKLDRLRAENFFLVLLAYFVSAEISPAEGITKACWQVNENHCGKAVNDGS